MSHREFKAPHTASKVHHSKRHLARTRSRAAADAVHGAQVYRACQMGYWRASKRWCKQLPSETVNKALAIFANNEAGLRPSDIYAGPSGAIAQLQQLAAWFQVSLPALYECLKSVGASPLVC